jgi:serine/threonine-protein kinase HipA
MKNALSVFLNASRIGTISLLPGEQTLFTFDEAYVRATSRSILSQYYLNRTGELRLAVKPTQRKLPVWFSNLLPEGMLREYLAKQASINPNHEFALIKFLGEDLPGAARIVPTDISENPLLDSVKGSSSKDHGPLRFSLAGVQIKFSALMKRGGRLTVPASGMGGDWIVKLPAANFPSVPENEAAMLTLASLTGIDVPEHRLVRIREIGGLPSLGVMTGEYALAVRRFDRQPGGVRIHMEDLAQVFGVFPHDKYGKVGLARIAEMIRTVLGEPAAQEFVARIVFIILTGNGDMHLKNWSLLYPDEIRPRLSPAYDLVSTVPYLPDEKLALNLVGEKNFTALKLDHFRRLAEQAGLSEPLTVATVRRVLDAVQAAWPKVRSESLMSADIIKRIDDHIRALSRLLR